MMMVRGRAADGGKVVVQTMVSERLEWAKPRTGRHSGVQRANPHMEI